MNPDPDLVKYCNCLLKFRKQPKFCSPVLLVLYASLFACALALFRVWSRESIIGGAVLLGYVSGSVMTNHMYCRVSKKTWPFTERLLKWDLVESIVGEAEGEESKVQDPTAS